MTQQPYPPQGFPQQGYPPQPQQQYPAPPQQAYPPSYPQAPGYPPQQGYGQFPQQPPSGPPQQPLAQGSLDDFYSQPSAGTGPSISWTDKNSNQPKPIGTSYAGIVARDVTHADVQQQTDFRTQAPLFYRDGRPKFAMKVPLKVQPSPEFPEGEATWFVKGQARDELVRAMAEAGCDGSPKAGAAIVVTLVQRRNTSAGMSPANVVQVRYQPAPGHTTGQQGAPAAAAPAAPPQQVQPPQQEQFQQPPAHQFQGQQYGQAVQPQGQQGLPPEWAQAPQQAPQQAPAQQFQQPAVQQAQPPAQQPAQGQGLTPPPDMSPEQQALLATLTGPR